MTRWSCMKCFWGNVIPFTSVVLSALLLISGCAPLDLDSLPPEIAHVMRNSDSFAQTADNALANVTPGTATDDLASLSGCYGAYYEFTYLGLKLTGCEVYHFDSASGEMSHWTLQGSASDGPENLTFSLAGNDRISVGGRTFPNGNQEVEALVTLSGDEMNIAYISQDGNFLDGTVGETGDERVALVFKKFDCP